MSETNAVRPAQHQERQPGQEHRMQPEPDHRPRYPGSRRLADKVVILTGGDSGIGRAVATLFAREGAKLALVYLDETRDAVETQKLVQEEGSQAILISGDVGDKSFCEAVVRTTIDRFGRIDILVNNAAEQHVEDDPEDITEQSLNRTFRTNIFGYVFMAQAALRHMQPGAAIINTTSITAFRGSSHLIDYASTKGAILAFTRSLASNLAKKNIRVNAVAPGPIWTPLIPASFDADHVARFGAGQPLGRAGQPNEVAPCYLFLACEDGSYMTGQTLHPNGGEIVGG